MNWPPAGIDWYYSDEYTAIACANNKDIMPLLPRVDLLLTDPPYGIGEAAGKNKGRGLLAKPKDYGNASWDNETSPGVYEAIKQAEHSIIFGGNFYNLPPSSCWLVWDKDNAGTDFADCELAWTNFKSAVRLFRYRWNGMLQGNMKDKEVRQHPTQKPLPLMKWCVENYSEPGQIILDPFMGSGTTLRACKDLGRKCIGIEREEDYVKVAVDRLRQEVLAI
jgi:DNA modification methylase